MITAEFKKWLKDHAKEIKRGRELSEAWHQGAQDGYDFAKEEFLEVIKGIGIPRPNELHEDSKTNNPFMQGYRHARNELRKCKNGVFQKLK